MRTATCLVLAALVACGDRGVPDADTGAGSSSDPATGDVGHTVSASRAAVECGGEPALVNWTGEHTISVWLCGLEGRWWIGMAPTGLPPGSPEDEDCLSEDCPRLQSPATVVQTAFSRDDAAALTYLLTGDDGCWVSYDPVGWYDALGCDRFWPGE